MANFKLFGFRITNDEDGNEDKKIQSFVEEQNDDGGVLTYGQAGSYVNVTETEMIIQNERQLIQTYREISMIPEVDQAIEDIISEFVVSDEFELPVKLNLDDLKLPASSKKQISEEFENILDMMQFKTKAHDIVRRWYIDGRYFLHIMIDEKNPADGIQGLRYINPMNIKLIKEKILDDNHAARINGHFPGVFKIGDIIQYWLYMDPTQQTGVGGSIASSNLLIAHQSIGYSNSGLTDASSNIVLSYLQKAIKPANQLRMLEDAQVVYIFTRAPERRAVYIDTGLLPTGRAEQYANTVMQALKNRIIYDGATGQVREGRRFMAMTEDIYIPRREGSTATEIVPLPGGDPNAMISSLEYFQKKLNKALNVPVSRTSEEARFSIGKSTEISRDEAKYARFIQRLRTRFSMIFDQILSRQLALKGLVSIDEWEDIKKDVHYDFLRDNYFSEMLENEVLMERLNILQMVDAYKDRYFSDDFIQKKILRRSEEEIKELKKQQKKEREERAENPELDPMNQPFVDPNAQFGQDPYMQQPMMQQQPVQQELPPAAPPAQESSVDYTLEKFLNVLIEESEQRMALLPLSTDDIDGSIEA